MEGGCDSLGRRSRLRTTSTGKRVSPPERDLRWFAALAEHGPLPSSFLLAFAQDSHASQKRARERLAELFHESNTPDGGPYLSRPPQQFRTIDSRYNQLVYDLAPAAISALKSEEVYQRRCSGPWLHNHMVACITASIELACLNRADIAYIPQSAILSWAKAELRWPTTLADPSTGKAYPKDLLPDAVFGLEYQTCAGSRFRFFAVEADRATEPVTTANFNRKSYLRHLVQYAEYVERGGYREHLQLSAPLFVLNVTSDPGRMERMRALCAEHFPQGNNYQLFQCWEDFGPVYRPPTPNPALLDGDWVRAALPPTRIEQV